MTIAGMVTARGNAKAGFVLCAMLLADLCTATVVRLPLSCSAESSFEVGSVAATLFDLWTYTSSKSSAYFPSAQGADTLHRHGKYPAAYYRP